ncbi:MAG: thiol oxidoreductase [Saprospiraceae bacterium]|nr:thiol oxidoreductase [Saprospiraceae bacterium]
MKNHRNFNLLVLFSMLIISFSCEKIFPALPNEEDILEGPLQRLSTFENALFLKGDKAFNEVFTSESGLGPLFVANSCGSCHAGDGKGHLFTTLTRFGQTDSTGNKYLLQGGPQLQNRALPGFQPEMIPVGASFSKFTPPAVTGLGYLSLVSDEDLLAIADPFDADSDGISGVPNWISLPDFIVPGPGSVSNDGKYMGRFGKKAAVYNLLHQTVNAYNQDMGIASIFNPFDVFSGLEIDPEVSTERIHELVFYLQTLKAPIPRNQEDPDVRLGKNLFEKIKCSSCHLPSLKTQYSPIAALSNQVFNPYTDLLLHDMGPGLDDGYTEGNAKSSEWRTPALWGLGLSPNAQGGQYFLLHDGRARSIEEAILWHGGEAEDSKNQYQNLSNSDKDALIRFLKSL